MLDGLLDLVKEHAGEMLSGNTAVPAEHHEAVMNEATQSITDGLQNAASQGGLQDIVSMFSNPSAMASNPVVSNIMSTLTQNLSSKFGIDASAASGMASSIIPQVMSKFVNKTNDPNDSSFNISDVVSHLAGGQGGAGGLNIADIASKFTGGEGGLGGMISGMFGGNK